MRGVWKLLAILGIVLLVGGIGVSGIQYARIMSARLSCKNNMKLIGLALANYHDTYRNFPPGTMPNAALPPDQRFSWLMEIHPYLEASGPPLSANFAKPWDAPENSPLRQWTLADAAGRSHAEPIPDRRYLICPAEHGGTGQLRRSPTDYVGIAGVGADAADLPLSDRRAGFFGYDRVLSHKEVRDGESTTIAVAEVTDRPPWTAGGSATVRGVRGGEQPYLGEGGQFSSFHRGGGVLSWKRPIVTHVLFVDGSVRGLTDAVAPQALEALATVNGGENVGEPPGEK